MTTPTLADIKAAISDPAFSHTRRGNGCWRDLVWIYHRDERSPSGVSLATAGDFRLVEAALDAARRPFPLSPTEGL